MSERENDRQLTAREYLQIIARRKLIVLTAVLAALLGAVVLSLLQSSIYTAEAEMLVEPRSGVDVFQPDQALAVQNLERAIQTEIQVLEGQQVRERVRRDLGLTNFPPAVNGTAINNTDVVRVEVRSGDPSTAQLLANAYIDAYVATRRDQAIESLGAAGGQLQGKIAELQAELDALDQETGDVPFLEANTLLDPVVARRQSIVNQQAAFEERLDQLQVDAALTTGGASVVRSAELPQSASEPTVLRTAGLALLVGLVLGIAAAMVIDHLDDSIQTPGDLEGVTPAPVLAVVPVEPPPDHRPIALSEPQEFAVEAYRGLRTNVQFLGLDAPMRTIQVTSSLPGEGKTTTATNLAVVLAQSGRQVALVDADLRRPRMHEVFSIPAQPGLTEILLGDPLDLVINHVEGLHVVTAGTVPASPSELLTSPRLGALLADLAARYEFVVVDSAPVLPVADAVALSVAVEGVLMVVQAGRTSQRSAREAFGQLNRVEAPVRGVVLNRVERGRGQGYGYGYGYYYGNGVRTQGGDDTGEDAGPTRVSAEAVTADPPRTPTGSAP